MKKTWSIHQMLRGVVTALLGVVACSALAQDRLEGDNPDYVVYEVKEGETLRSIARRFMGGSQYDQELLNYNKIANPTVVGEGYLLAIPRGIRMHAIERLSEAESALGEAVEVNARAMAPEDFARARDTVLDARAERENGSYHKSMALAELAILRSEYARDLAESRAPIRMEAVLVSVEGDVTLSLDDGATWSPAQVDEHLPVTGLLKTGPDGKAELQFMDGSLIRVMGAYEFQIDRFVAEREQAMQNPKLKVILGNMLEGLQPRAPEAPSDP